MNGASISGLHSADLYNVFATQQNFIPKTTFTFSPGTKYPMPTGLTVSNLTYHSATLSWTENGTATAWKVAYKAMGAADFTEVATTSKSFTLDGLLNYTQYIVKVGSDNVKVGSDNNERFVKWSDEISFTTPEQFPMPTDLTASNIAYRTATVSWKGTGNSYDLRYGNNVSYATGNVLTTNFDDSSFDGWTTIDADGDGYTWELASHPVSYFNSGVNLSYTGYNESKDFVLSGSYSNVLGALNPDNYLVSPKVKLGGSITFYAWAQDTNYPTEHFGVAVSTTNNFEASAFTTIQT